MNAPGNAAPPTWFWVVSVFALLWNVLGIVAFVGQQSMDPASLPPAEQDFYATIPAWVTAAFAIAVFSGTLGCVGLLLRKRWAYPVLVVSLLAIVAQISHSIFFSNGIDVFGPAGLVLPSLTLTIGLALVWFTRFAMARHWL